MSVAKKSTVSPPIATPSLADLAHASEFGGSDVVVVDELDPANLPRVSRTKLLVEMTHDGLGRAQRLPIIALRGKKDGPVFGITNAVHGNEINGIPVIHQLMESLDLKKLCGTVIAVPVVNIPGYLDYVRNYRDGRDLNHTMPGIADGNESETFASRFIDRIISKFDYLVDLHTASFGRVNSLYVRANMLDERTAKMARLQRPQIILHNPPSDRTLRGVAAGMGIPAITVEVADPQVFQPKHIRATLSGIRAIMADLCMIAKRKLTPSPPPIICSSSKWLFTSHGGVLNHIPDIAEIVSTGDLLGRQCDIFGTVLAEYRAPSAGVIIGKSKNPISPTGARILHLGKLATNADGFICADNAVTPKASCT